MKQLNLFTQKVPKTFGGAITKRKTMRPLDRRKPLHLILKACGPWQLLRQIKRVEEICRLYGERFGIKVCDLAVHADHIHLVLRIHDRPAYVKWIRAVTAILVRRIQGLKWKQLPFSRIVTWGRDLAGLQIYLGRNRAEVVIIFHAHACVESLQRRFP